MQNSSIEPSGTVELMIILCGLVTLSNTTQIFDFFKAAIFLGFFFLVF